MGMGLFWAIVVALTVVVLTILIQALRRGGAAAAVDHPDLKVYRDQLAEVDRDMARGVLSGDEGARLKTEVSRRLLEADRVARGAQLGGAKGGVAAAAALVLVLIGGAVWLYTYLGVPGYADLPLVDRLAMAEEAYATRPSQAEAMAAAPMAPAPQVDNEFTALMEKLRAAVAERPDDTQGLDLLARNEAALGNFSAAVQAQEQLIAVKGAAAGLADHLGAAQFMVMAAGGYVSPEAEAHVIKVLEQDPQNGLARYLSGLMFAQVGRPDRAFAIWEPLLAEGPADAPWLEPIRMDIGTVAESAGIKYSPPDAKGPSMADMQAAGDMTPEERQAMIEGMVGQLEERLLAQGGPVEDWLKLINALGVLGQPDRAAAALAAAEAALAADPAALEQVRAAAGAAP